MMRADGQGCDFERKARGGGVMRRVLKRMVGERRMFRATFARYGWRPSRKGQSRQTVLLVDLADLEGNPISDHIWFNCNRRFILLGKREGGLRQGDLIEFEAIVTRYTRRIIDVVEPGCWWPEVDYGLRHPAYLRRVELRIPVDWPVPQQVGPYA
jgi:hypothetical protein